MICLLVEPKCSLALASSKNDTGARAPNNDFKALITIGKGFASFASFPKLCTRKLWLSFVFGSCAFASFAFASFIVSGLEVVVVELLVALGLGLARDERFRFVRRPRHDVEDAREDLAHVLLRVRVGHLAVRCRVGRKPTEKEQLVRRPAVVGLVRVVEDGVPRVGVGQRAFPRAAPRALFACRLVSAPPA